MKKSTNKKRSILDSDIDVSRMTLNHKKPSEADIVLYQNPQTNPDSQEKSLNKIQSKGSEEKKDSQDRKSKEKDDVNFDYSNIIKQDSSEKNSQKMDNSREKSGLISQIDDDLVDQSIEKKHGLEAGKRYSKVMREIN